MNVPPSVKANIFIETAEKTIFEAGIMFFERLASAQNVEIAEKFNMEDAVTVVSDSARIFIPMDELVDKEKELLRLNKELLDAKKDVEFLSSKLSNEGFLAKAPEKLIDVEKAKLAKANERFEKIEQSIKNMQK